MLERDGLTDPSGLILLTQIASALDAAHESGIAHGWVRPEAVLVDASGWAWLSDFGLTPGSADPSANRAALRRHRADLLRQAQRAQGRWDTASGVVEAAMAHQRRAPEGGGRPVSPRMRRLVQPRREAP